MGTPELPKLVYPFFNEMLAMFSCYPVKTFVNFTPGGFTRASTLRHLSGLAYKWHDDVLQWLEYATRNEVTRLPLLALPRIHFVTLDRVSFCADLCL